MFPLPFSRPTLRCWSQIFYRTFAVSTLARVLLKKEMLTKILSHCHRVLPLTVLQFFNNLHFRCDFYWSYTRIVVLNPTLNPSIDKDKIRSPFVDHFWYDNVNGMTVKEWCISHVNKTIDWPLQNLRIKNF